MEENLGLFYYGFFLNIYFPNPKKVFENQRTSPFVCDVFAFFKIMSCTIASTDHGTFSISPCKFKGTSTWAYKMPVFSAKTDRFATYGS